MAKRTARNKKFILEMAKDVELLRRAIFANKFLSTRLKGDCFQTVISELKKKPENRFSYDSDVLTIMLNASDSFPSCFAAQNTPKKMQIHFSTKAKGFADAVLEDRDPFNSLEFNIYAIAYDEQNREMVYSLHFDRHIEPEKGDADSIEPHPIYHFQFGGNKLQNSVNNLGDTFFFDAPRIMHHPMEFILGVDFLLSSFLPVAWNELQQESGYTKIIKRYQRYFVYPYFKSIYSHFDDSHQNGDWPPQKIYPQLVI